MEADLSWCSKFSGSVLLADYMIAEDHQAGGQEVETVLFKAPKSKTPGNLDGRHYRRTTELQVLKRLLLAAP